MATVYRPSSASKASEPPSPEASALSRSSATDAGTATCSAAPPSKATSIRTRSSATADQLREDAAGGVGVQEGDLQAEEARARLLVDQRRAVGGEAVELGGDVVGLEG